MNIVTAIRQLNEMEQFIQRTRMELTRNEVWPEKRSAVAEQVARAHQSVEKMKEVVLFGDHFQRDGNYSLWAALAG